MSTLFITENHRLVRSQVLCGGLAKRPSLQVTAPKFGAWLKARREFPPADQKPKSLEGLAKRLRPLVAASGLKVTTSTLTKFEQGRVPNWPMLFALSIAYEIPILQMVAQLVGTVEFPGRRDLIGREGDQTSNLLPHQEVADVTASTRIRELEGRVSEYEAALTEINGVASHLARLAAFGPQSRRTPRSKPKSGRGH